MSDGLAWRWRFDDPSMDGWGPGGGHDTSTSFPCLLSSWSCFVLVVVLCLFAELQCCTFVVLPLYAVCCFVCLCGLLLVCLCPLLFVLFSCPLLAVCCSAWLFSLNLSSCRFPGSGASLPRCLPLRQRLFSAPAFSALHVFSLFFPPFLQVCFFLPACVLGVRAVWDCLFAIVGVFVCSFAVVMFSPVLFLLLARSVLLFVIYLTPDWDGSFFLCVLPWLPSQTFNQVSPLSSSYTFSLIALRGGW